MTRANERQSMTQTIGVTRCTKRQREMVDRRMEELGFSSDAEYVRHLVVRDYEDSRWGSSDAKDK